MIIWRDSGSLCIQMILFVDGYGWVHGMNDTATDTVWVGGCGCDGWGIKYYGWMGWMGLDDEGK